MFGFVSHYCNAELWKFLKVKMKFGVEAPCRKHRSVPMDCPHMPYKAFIRVEGLGGFRV